MLRILPVLLLFSWPCRVGSQTLISSLKLGSRTQAELLAQFQIPFIQFGVDYYRIIYTMNGVSGQLDTVSGLVVVPDNPNRIYPRLVYQHGTSSTKLDVPSFNVVNGGEGYIGWLMGGLGYAALLPDYLGLGVSDGFHPYIHAETEASAALNMLQAFQEFAVQHGVQTNDQLFITGYSQGGHASMALHRAVETNWKGVFTTTAAAHLSGPYSMGEVMRDFFLSDEVYAFPGYVPYVVLSYQTMYGNLFSQVEDFFKPAYAGAISLFFDNQISLSNLHDRLSDSLFAREGSNRPTRMLQDSVLQNVLSQPDHAFNVALRANNTYQWAPEAPTRIFYCLADDQVPYENGVTATDTMLARGAVQLVGADVNPAADHGECVLPALTQTMFFFLGFQQIGTVGLKDPGYTGRLSLWPNPARDELVLNDLPSAGLLRVYDVTGKVRLAMQLGAGSQSVWLEELADGVYVVLFESEGKVWSGKLVVQR